MARSASQATGELLSAIAVIGVTAVAAAILFVTFAEQNQEGTEVIDTRGEIELARASELVDTSHVSCAGTRLSFLLHNYSRDYAMSTDGFRAYILDSGGELAFRLSEGGDDYIEIMTPSVTGGAWHHVVLTNDGSGTREGMKVYLDGEPAESVPGGGAGAVTGSILNNFPIGIGASSTGKDPVSDAAIDELILSRHLLTPGQVEAYYLSGTYPYTAIIHLPFEDDLVSNDVSNHGTLVSGTEEYTDSTREPGLGRALVLNGTHVTVPEVNLDYDANEIFTISFWIKKTAPDDVDVSILSKSDQYWNSGLNVWMWSGSGGKLKDGDLGSIEWLALDMATAADEIPPATTIVVRYDGYVCGDMLILQTPSGEIVRVRTA